MIETQRVLIGIDPGLTGAIAIITPQRGIDLYDTPILHIGKKNVFNAAGMAELLNMFDNAFVTIESVHAMPAQGVTSMFNMGKGYGIWLGIMAAYHIPYREVAAATWKKHYQLTKDKELSRYRAIQLHPEAAARLARKKDHGRAEALLLAMLP